MIYPQPGDTYVPSFPPEPDPVTDDDIRGGTLVVVNDDGLSGLAVVKKGLVVSYVRVLLNSDGTIQGPAPYKINRYTKVTKESPK